MPDAASNIGCSRSLLGSRVSRYRAARAEVDRVSGSPVVRKLLAQSAKDFGAQLRRERSPIHEFIQRDDKRVDHKGGSGFDVFAQSNGLFFEPFDALSVGKHPVILTTASPESIR